MRVKDKIIKSSLALGCVCRIAYLAFEKVLPHDQPFQT